MLNELVFQGFLFGCIAFLVTIFAFQIASRAQKHWQARQDRENDEASFILRGGRVIDASFSARALIEAESHPNSAPEKALLRFLSRNFEIEAEDWLKPHPKGRSEIAQSHDLSLNLASETVGETVRLRILPAPRSSDPVDLYVLQAAQDELRALRANTHSAPFLLWRQNADGAVIWVNQTYAEMAERVLGKSSTSAFPFPVLFPEITCANGEKSVLRASVQPQLAAPEWFDCHVVSLGDDLLCTAFHADEAVHADLRRREFTQTLTKTFADLTIGLAIFDRSRQLVLFNPALLDLTSLPSDFLLSRPSLVGFLDRLRENRVMPEPRDYRSWRKAIAELETEASHGTYSEDWSLPDGRTFRVSGHPHPDGAVALLFEDISAEMSLTRRFRAEIEQLQAVVDALDAAVAVFAADGNLTFTNQAYDALWGNEHSETVAQLSVVETTRLWHEQSVPTPVWGDLRDFVQHSKEREEWFADVPMRDGRLLACRFLPLRSGATLVMFTVSTANDVGEPRLIKAG